MPSSVPRAGLTFPKSKRVRDRKEFQRIQGRGIRLATPHFLVMALRQQGPRRSARLGITASKKSGESVQRSRIKRLIREAFRLHQSEFPDGWDFVVIAREGTDRVPLTEIVTSLRSALNKLKQGAGRPPSDARPPAPRHDAKRPRPPKP
jgi:ribonuclease P protein component